MCNLCQSSGGRRPDLYKRGTAHALALTRPAPCVHRFKMYRPSKIALSNPGYVNPLDITAEEAEASAHRSTASASSPPRPVTAPAQLESKSRLRRHADAHVAALLPEECEPAARAVAAALWFALDTLKAR